MVVTRLCSSQHYIFANSQLIRSVGITAAALITRIHYWLQKDKGGVVYDNAKFIYNTAAQWSEQLGVSSRQIERAVAKLKALGLIRIEKLAKHKSIRTNHYTINYEALEALVSAGKITDMSGSSRQNVGMYNTKNTDSFKDINNNFIENKSKTHTSGAPENNQESQVKQVSKIKKRNIIQNKIMEMSSSKNNQIVQEMIKIWQDIFPQNTVKLNKELARFLHSALKTKFNSDMDLWKHYCQTLETSKYLMGKEFDLRLSWAISFKTIDRIKNGELGVKSIPIPGAAKKLESEIIHEIQNLNEPDACIEMRLIILKRYGVHAYNAWIRKSVLFKDGKDICYQAETAYGQDFIENHFGRLIKSRKQEIRKEGIHHAQISSSDQLILMEIDKLKEPEKCLNTRKMLLSILGEKSYKTYIHPLIFSCEEGRVVYQSSCQIQLDKAGEILTEYGISLL